MQKKKRFIESNIEELNKDADKLTLKAAKEKYFFILERSNDSRLLITKKKEEINELD